MLYNPKTFIHTLRHDTPNFDNKIAKESINLAQTSPNSSTPPQQPNTQQKPAPFNLRSIGIQPTEAEIKEFPAQNKIGIRNRKKGSPGYGSMHYYDKSNPQFQQFIDELKASFGL